jgi:hypothetical protein
LLVVGLKNDSNLNIEYIVAPQKHPPSSARQHLASQPRTVEAAACEARDAPYAIWCLAERENRHFECNRERNSVAIPGIGVARVDPAPA